MNVNLGEHFESYVVQLVNSGRYQSQSEVVRESLRLLQQQQAFNEQKLKNLRKAIDAGMDSFRKSGGVVLATDDDIDAAFERIMNRPTP